VPFPKPIRYLEKANNMVLYDVAQGEQRMPPNMHLNHETPRPTHL
jgi:hypothetical protein